MRITSSLLLAAATVVTLSPALTLASDIDVKPSVVDNKIVTGGYIDGGTEQPEGPLSVFGFAFGENVADPYNLDDPGFNSNGPAGFAAETSLRLSFLPLPGGSFIQYWDGNGTPAFGALPATASPVTLTLGSSLTSFARLTATSLTYVGVGTNTSIFASPIVDGGVPDDHLLSNLGFLDGSEDAIANPLPVGAYLISAQLLNPGTGGADASDTLYFIFANGIEEPQLDAAIEAVNTALVPEPAALGLLTLAVPMLARRRR